MTRTSVSLMQARDYESPTLRRAIGGAVDAIGGWSRFVRPGDRVLVKPNCLTGGPAERAAVTHPALVAEICRQLIDLGARPFVGDSPAWGSFQGVASSSGLTAALKPLNVPLVPFRRPVRVENAAGRVYSHLTLDRTVVEADAVVNVPKLKSHRQLYVTLAIKNVFGCVPGKRKAWWHFKAGNYENYFGRMLCEVYALVRPALTIMDAIVVMEGKGPAAGDPRALGAVLASADAPALERIACEVIGAEPHRVRTLVAAAELGIGTPQRDNIDVGGDPIDAVRISDFRFPSLIPIGFSLPRVVRSTLKNAWIVHQEQVRARRASA